MRGINTDITDIRRKIFTEVSRLAYGDEDYSKIENLPYEILPGEISPYQDNIFLERAVIGERLRLAIGLPVRKADEHAPLATGITESAIAERYYEPPLVNVIKFACHSCPDNVIHISDMCQGCMAHPCIEVCPKKAIYMKNGRSYIDQEKCIKCGKCVNICPYEAIKRMERPCVKACGMDAIKSDEFGRADIDYEKCVSCGMCLVNCPFGAIADKGQIFQTILAIKSETPVYAIIAPAFMGQFGAKVAPEMMRSIVKQLGFEDAVEVAIGADLCTIAEAKDFLEEVPEKKPFMATSCCPAWSVMAKKMFPEFAENISMALTPMVLTGRLVKRKHPGCKVAFIGPCSAKKLEAARRTIRSDVDFVLTFEEFMGMVEAKGIDLENITDKSDFSQGTGDGRKFAVSGGVAQAVVNCIKELEPEREVKVACAEGLANCRKLLEEARKGTYNGYLLEGMGCPGGCVGGAGTMQPINKASAMVELNKKKAELQNSLQSTYKEYLDMLEEKKDI